MRLYQSLSIVFDIIRNGPSALALSLVPGILIFYFRNAHKPVLYCSSDESRQILKLCPSLASTYFPSLLSCWSNHIQIAFYIISNNIRKFLNQTRWRSEICVLEDGEQIHLDWALSDDPLAECGLTESRSSTPIVMINPGALGNSEKLLGQWVMKAHSRGWIVCCNNRRGHVLPLTRSKWNFFGSVKDTQYITRNYILKRRPNAKLLMIGISAGSGLLCRFFGEEDSLFLAGFGLNPGYDISVCMGRVETPYQGILLNGVKKFIKENAEMLQNVIGYQECLNAKNLQEFFDNAYAMAGYTSKGEYYDKECPTRVVKNIQNHVLVVNSQDDPVCVYQNVVDWLQLGEKMSKVIIAVTKVGSHCAFIEGLFMESWAERVAFEFFESVLSSIS